MRIVDILLNGLSNYEFENIKTFYQFLYMSEDNYIEIENVFNVHLQIRMDKKGYFICKNMDSSLDIKMFSDMNTSMVLFIIEQLKKQSPLKIKSFKNRWEEINAITYAIVSQNKMNRG